jgi:DNA-binding XRE family transcriptional regulator
LFPTVRSSKVAGCTWWIYPVAFYTSRSNDRCVPTFSRRNRKHPALTALGEAIRRVRIANGVSQEDLALRAELDRGYMGGVERGESNMTVLSVVRIAGALDMPASELLAQAGL